MYTRKNIICSVGKGVVGSHEQKGFRERRMKENTLNTFSTVQRDSESKMRDAKRKGEREIKRGEEKGSGERRKGE